MLSANTIYISLSNIKYSLSSSLTYFQYTLLANVPNYFPPNFNLTAASKPCLRSILLKHDIAYSPCHGRGGPRHAIQPARQAARLGGRLLASLGQIQLVWIWS